MQDLLNKKNQDVCVSPEGYAPEKETMTEGILREVTDYGKDYTERTISINIRSQMSSLAKNFDTLYERTIAEAQNLHVRCPEMVLGEVYMIPVKEYDTSVMDDNKVEFIDRIGAVEKYIKSFQAINMRTGKNDEKSKYERICLLIVDFDRTVLKIYNTTKELIQDGFLCAGATCSMNDLDYRNFIAYIMQVHSARFSANNLT